MYNCALWQQPWLGCLCCQRGPEHCMRLQIVTPVTRTGQMRRRHKRARAWRHASAWLGRTRCPLRRRWQRWQACCSRAAQLRTLPGLRCMPVHQARLRTCMQGAAVPAALPCSCCFCLLLNGLGGGRGALIHPARGTHGRSHAKCHVCRAVKAIRNAANHSCAKRQLVL